jgi:hypothetical protein
MNDSQLIERLAATDLYRNDRPLPETTRSDIALLDIARRMEMSVDTKEQVVAVEPRPRKRSSALIAAAAFALVIITGGITVLLTNDGGGTAPADTPTTLAVTPTTVVATPAPAVVEAFDIGAADPIQAINDQASRVTITFAGDAKALAEGNVHFFEIEVHLEGSRENAPGATVTYTNNGGQITTSGSSPTGNEMTATWLWFADDGLQVTLRGQGISIPDTRPEVVVSVQETASSQLSQFVMDTPAS